MGRCRFEDYKPTLAMVGLQFIYAGVTILGKAALDQGMSPRVYVVYRQGIASLALAPAAYFSRRNSSRVVLGRKGFCLVFIAALVGIAINLNLYFLGLDLGSPSMASAMTNLIPAITFLMAAPLGLEKVSVESPRGIAKIVGTIVCVGGAITMALLKGPKLLLHMGLQAPSSLLHRVGEDWMMGCLLLFGSCCCWSLWLILQVPISKSCSDPVYLSAWMCFFAFLQSAALALFLETEGRAWRLNTNLQIICCIYAGVAGSGVTICVQAWCISRRGPLFSALFNPMCTVISTIASIILLHEALHIGSLVGAVAVVVGLYVVLWGKAEDADTKRVQSPENDLRKATIIAVDDTAGRCKTGLEEPLLGEKLQDVEEGETKNLE